MIGAIIFIAAIVALAYYFKNKTRKNGSGGKPGKPVDEEVK